MQKQILTWANVFPPRGSHCSTWCRICHDYRRKHKSEKEERNAGQYRGTLKIQKNQSRFKRNAEKEDCDTKTLKKRDIWKRGIWKVILLGEKILVDDGRDIEEWVAHSEKDPIVVSGRSHDDESGKRFERLRFRSGLLEEAILVVSEAASL